ncbi:MAG: hypothetical protein AAB740_04550, partial [Patescibacteria group bacterium]
MTQENTKDIDKQIIQAVENLAAKREEIEGGGGAGGDEKLPITPESDAEITQKAIEGFFKIYIDALKGLEGQMKATDNIQELKRIWGEVVASETDMGKKFLDDFQIEIAGNEKGVETLAGYKELTGAINQKIEELKNKDKQEAMEKAAEKAGEIIEETKGLVQAMEDKINNATKDDLDYLNTLQPAIILGFSFTDKIATAYENIGIKPKEKMTLFETILEINKDIGDYNKTLRNEIDILDKFREAKIKELIEEEPKQKFKVGEVVRIKRSDVLAQIIDARLITTDNEGPRYKGTFAYNLQ